MRIWTRFSPEGFSNTYLVASEQDAVLIDPGTFDRQLLFLIEENKLHLGSVLLTHGHRSHMAGLRTITRIYDVTLHSYAADAEGCRCIAIRDGSRHAFGTEEILCLETAGHSPDSVCYKIGDCLFTGDTLMAGDIGSTPDAERERALQDSVWAKLFGWGDNALILPGHGPPSRVGVERMFNPRLACAPEPRPGRRENVPGSGR